MRHMKEAAALVVVASLALAALSSAGTSARCTDPPPTVYRFGVVGNRGKIAQLERDTPTVVAGITGTSCRSRRRTPTAMR